MLTWSRLWYATRDKRCKWGRCDSREIPIVDKFSFVLICKSSFGWRDLPGEVLNIHRTRKFFKTLFQKPFVWHIPEVSQQLIRCKMGGFISFIVVMGFHLFNYGTVTWLTIVLLWTCVSGQVVTKHDFILSGTKGRSSFLYANSCPVSYLSNCPIVPPWKPLFTCELQLQFYQAPRRFSGNISNSVPLTMFCRCCWTNCFRNYTTTMIRCQVNVNRSSLRALTAPNPPIHPPTRRIIIPLRIAHQDIPTMELVQLQIDNFMDIRKSLRRKQIHNDE